MWKRLSVLLISQRSGSYECHQRSRLSWDRRTPQYQLPQGIARLSTSQQTRLSPRGSSEGQTTMSGDVRQCQAACQGRCRCPGAIVTLRTIEGTAVGVESSTVVGSLAVFPSLRRRSMLLARGIRPTKLILRFYEACSGTCIFGIRQ